MGALDPEGARSLDYAFLESPSVAAARGVQYRERRIEGLRVLEVVLGPVDFDAPLPVVLQIHGRGDRARLPEGRYDRTNTPLRMLIPEAPRRLGLGFSWAPHSITEKKPFTLGAALTREADRLHRVLTYIEATRQVVGRPIVTGFSQGGMLTLMVALRHPEAISIAVPMAGFVPPHLIPGPADPAHRVPIRALHGTADPTVALAPTQVLVRRLQHLGYDITLEEYPDVVHEVSEPMRRRYRELLRSVIAGFSGPLGPSA